MQTLCRDIPCRHAVGPIALMLTLVLGMELTLPLSGYAQPSQGPASAPAVSVENQDLPPMQEAEIIEVRKPFYKKWWFWGIVAVAVAGGAAIAMTGIGGGGSDAPPPGGTVTVDGPAPR